MNEQNRTNLAATVRRLRTKRGLSIRGLAAAAEVDFGWLAKLERDPGVSPGPRVLRSLAQALEIEAAELFLAAGIEDEESLPKLAPYLRAKYDLPDDAVAQLEAHFQLLNERHQRGGRRG